MPVAGRSARCPSRRPWRLLVTASVLVAVSGMPALAQAPAPAETLFRTGCATCHSLARAVRPLRLLPVAERRAHLEQFLRHHHVADPADRALLVDYLAAAASR